MTEIISKLVDGWKTELEKNKSLIKLWKFFDLYNEEEGELIIQVKDEWEAYINVYQIVISVSKLEFEDTQKPFSPFLSVRKSAHVLEFKRYSKLDTLDDIIYKIEDFVSVLPDIKEKEKEKEEEEEEEED
tara:strand:- start:1386 stop:1775 length:390 start_codon:yes stop_codon:yes gene_type:complete